MLYKIISVYSSYLSYLSVQRKKKKITIIFVNPLPKARSNVRHYTFICVKNSIRVQIKLLLIKWKRYNKKRINKSLFK
jgi:hypothetical protein